MFSFIFKLNKSNSIIGFTLFEVAVSLLLVSFAVISVLLLFPHGLKQMQINKYKMYASAIAAQLVDTYNNGDITCSGIDYEAPYPWEITVDRRVNHPDLEIRCGTQRTGVIPIPNNIARRLDSDGDEIQHVLDDGGQLFYYQPQLANLWRDDVAPTAPPNDLKKIVFAVVGNAQHNASFSFPGKRWPYYQDFPSMPMMSAKFSPSHYPKSPTAMLQYAPFQNVPLEWDLMNSIPRDGKNPKFAEADSKARTRWSKTKTVYPGIYSSGINWSNLTFCMAQYNELGDADNLAYNVFRSAIDYLSYPTSGFKVDPKPDEERKYKCQTIYRPTVSAEYTLMHLQGMRIFVEKSMAKIPEEVSALDISDPKYLENLDPASVTSYGLMQRFGLYLYDAMHYLNNGIAGSGVEKSAGSSSLLNIYDITNIYLSGESIKKSILPSWNDIDSDGKLADWSSHMVYVDDVIPNQEQAAKVIMGLNYFSHALSCLTSRYPKDKAALNPFKFDELKDVLGIGKDKSRDVDGKYTWIGIYAPSTDEDAPMRVGIEPEMNIENDRDEKFLPKLNKVKKWTWSNLDDEDGEGTKGVDLDQEFRSDSESESRSAVLPGGVDPSPGLIKSGIINIRGRKCANGQDPVFPVNLRPSGHPEARLWATDPDNPQGKENYPVSQVMWSSPVGSKVSIDENSFGIPMSIRKIFKVRDDDKSLKDGYNNRVVTHDIIVRLQSVIRRQYYHFCAKYPYNFAVPRPLSQPIMMDYPLLELDMFRPPYGLGMVKSGLPEQSYIIGSKNNVSGTPLQKAAQWKYMSPSTITTLRDDVNGRFPADVAEIQQGKIGGGISFLGNANDPIAKNAPASQLGQFFSENGVKVPARTRYTLLNKFDASERCRELVFWAVDWQEYEDFETSPSESVDASRYPLSAPGGYYGKNVGSYVNFSNGITSYTGHFLGMDIMTRMRGCSVVEDPTNPESGTNGQAVSGTKTMVYGSDGRGFYGVKFCPDALIPHYRNPERNLLFLIPTQGNAGRPGFAIPALLDFAHSDGRIPNGTDMSDFIMNRKIDPPPDYGPPVPTIPDDNQSVRSILLDSVTFKPASGKGNYPPMTISSGYNTQLVRNVGTYPEIFSGQFGADRNGNKTLDRGAIEKSVRLRASIVARYNFYDMRAQCQFR